MCEDLKIRTEAQGKVDKLEVSVLLFSAVFKRTETKLLFLRFCLTTAFAFIIHIPFHKWTGESSLRNNRVAGCLYWLLGCKVMGLLLHIHH